MTQKTFTKIVKRILEIAEDNEIDALTMTIRTKGGRVIKGWTGDIDSDDEDFLQIFTDDSYKFISYTEIETIEI